MPDTRISELARQYAGERDKLAAELDAMTRTCQVARDMLAEAQSTIRVLTVDLAAARARLDAVRRMCDEADRLVPSCRTHPLLDATAVRNILDAGPDGKD